MSRIENLLKKLPEHNIDALLICSNQNNRYISGFSSTEPNIAFSIISANTNTLITDYRFAEQAQQECTNFNVVIRDRQTQTLGQAIEDITKSFNIKRLGFERDHFLFGLLENIRSDLKNCELIPTSNIVEVLRQIKDDFEVESIRQAASIADKALEQLLSLLKPGMTEKEAALELEYLMAKGGSEDLAFPTIFISGVRSSMPHGMPSDKKIELGDIITIDFGAVINGYRSDMTRTIVMGKASDEQKKVYNTIKQAQQIGVDAVRAGIPGKEPYFKVREFLNKCDYVEHVGEGLGHCVGLSLHERPYLEQACDDILEEGFVLTIEPGIYIPNWGGVRIEDDLKVTANGSDVLTRFPKELIEL